VETAVVHAETSRIGFLHGNRIELSLVVCDLLTGQVQASLAVGSCDALCRSGHGHFLLLQEESLPRVHVLLLIP
jgi:hypothetical protein